MAESDPGRSRGHSQSGEYMTELHHQLKVEKGLSHVLRGLQEVPAEFFNRTLLFDRDDRPKDFYRSLHDLASDFGEPFSTTRRVPELVLGDC